jgi:hypothetical protein
VRTIKRLGASSADDMITRLRRVAATAMETASATALPPSYRLALAAGRPVSSLMTV